MTAPPSTRAARSPDRPAAGLGPGSAGLTRPSRGWGALAVLAALGAALMAAPPSMADAGPVSLRLGRPSVDPAWVGQQVVVPVRLTMAGIPAEAPKLRVPEVPGGVFLYLPGAALFDSEYGDDGSVTWTYSFVFYPHRPGEHVIPPVGVDVRMAAEDRSSRLHSAASGSLTLRSRMPEGARDASLLITSPRLEVEETWSPEATQVRVGDAVTRTVTLRAEGVLGMGLPPLAFEAPAGIAAYPRPPDLEGESAAGKVTGERTETVVYVCERQGSVTLPAIVIPWLDPRSGELRRIELAERTLSVAANPALATAADRDETAPWGSWGAWGSLVVVMALLLAAAARRHGPRAAAAVHRWRARRKRDRAAGLPPLNPSVRA